MVTDREKAITNAIENELEHLLHRLCWNHIKRDIRFYLTRNGASSDDVSVYSIHVSQLLLCESEEDYHLTYETLSCMWSKSWKFYFDKHLASDIATKAGKWLLDSDAIYGEDSIICPFSGITTNVSESFNKVLKDLNKWREVPVDLMVLTL